MVHGGIALARLSEGRLALVRGGLPGERVKVNLKERSGVLQGAVSEIVDASPHRVTPSPHPGLDYSHMSYAHQLELKRSVVEDALARSLKREVRVPPALAAPESWGYRSAVQPAVSRGTTETALGYRRPESSTFVPLRHDPTACESINRVWTLLRQGGVPKGVREVAFRSGDAGEVLLCLIASASAKNYLDFAHSLVREGVAGVSYAPFDARGRFRSGSERLAGARSIGQRYGAFELSVTATSFAQPNPAAASRLYTELTRWAGRGGAALDLYAGSGVIGLHLAQAFAQVTALELDRSSVVRGGRDAKRLGVDNLTFVHADARKLAELPDAELIAVDPPRAGLAKGTRQAVTGSSAKRLLYVSCDVATWARDVAEFEAAGWRLDRVQPFDFYPQTHHIELLSLLTR
jgi:tRNA/tmRNA/rRNA uracil-C5-methylase (TrmA/RlmC/RlmD family)